MPSASRIVLYCLISDFVMLLIIHFPFPSKIAVSRESATLFKNSSESSHIIRSITRNKSLKFMILLTLISFSLTISLL